MSVVSVVGPSGYRCIKQDLRRAHRGRCGHRCPIFLLCGAAWQAVLAKISHSKDINRHCTNQRAAVAPRMMPTSSGRIVESGRSARTLRITAGGGAGPSGIWTLTGGFASMTGGFNPRSFMLRTCSGEYVASRRCESPPLFEPSVGEFLVSNGCGTGGVSTSTLEEPDACAIVNSLRPLLRLLQSKHKQPAQQINLDTPARNRGGEQMGTVGGRRTTRHR